MLYPTKLPTKTGRSLKNTKKISLPATLIIILLLSEKNLLVFRTDLCFEKQQKQYFLLKKKRMSHEIFHRAGKSRNLFMKQQSLLYTVAEAFAA